MRLKKNRYEFFLYFTNVFCSYSQISSFCFLKPPLKTCSFLAYTRSQIGGNPMGPDGAKIILKGVCPDASCVVELDLAVCSCLLHADTLK